MATSKKRPDAWREAIKLISRCPICSNNYPPEEAKVFAKKGAARLVHITCPTCKSFFVAMIVLLGQGVSSVGMVTDLSFEDAQRLHRAPSITVDETIDGYELLHNSLFLHSLLLNGK